MCECDELRREKSVSCLRVSLGLFLLSAAALAHAGSPGECPGRPSYQPLRYDEDWSVLANSACRTEMLDHIKYVPFSRDGWYLSMGGEIRQRYENYQNPGFGSDPKDDNGYLLQRYLLHADSHFGSRFRLFVQLQS